jgi:hypothetical protein
MTLRHPCDKQSTARPMSAAIPANRPENGILAAERR